MPEMIEAPYDVKLFPGPNGDMRPIKVYPSGGTSGLTPDEAAVWGYVQALRQNQSTGRRVAVLYYPPGDTDNGDGPRSNQAIAREIMEVLTAPGVDANPNRVVAVILARIPADLAGGWTWVPPHTVDEVMIREGIPPATPEVQAPAPVAGSPGTAPASTPPANQKPTGGRRGR